MVHSSLDYPILMDLQVDLAHMEDLGHMVAHMGVDYLVRVVQELVGQDLHLTNNPDMLVAALVLGAVWDYWQVHSLPVASAVVEQGVTH